MPNNFYVDELLQSFVSDGNVFLKLGAVSGDINPAGDDIKEISTILIIPINRFQEFAKNIKLAAELYPATTQEAISVVVDNSQADGVQLGAPLVIPD